MAGTRRSVGYRQRRLMMISTMAVLSVLTGCSTTTQVPAETREIHAAVTQPPQPPVSIAIKPPPPTFLDVYQSWKGTPYRLGGSSRRGIDCSAFVQLTYSEVYRQMLPRTTAEQSQLGKAVPRTMAKKGDLVFFRTGRRMRHVGIYMGNNEFLHASTSQGVVVSSLDTPYWQRAFWQIRRIQ